MSFGTPPPVRLKSSLWHPRLLNRKFPHTYKLATIVGARKPVKPPARREWALFRWQIRVIRDCDKNIHADGSADYPANLLCGGQTLLLYFNFGLCGCGGSTTTSLQLTL